MNSNQTLHQTKLAKWTSLFHEQRESGLTVKDWCSQNNVSPYAFFYWKRIAKEAYVQSIVPNNPSRPPMCGNDSHELYNLRNWQTPASVPDSPLTLSLPGIKIEFEGSISDNQILQVLKAVRHV